MDSEYRSTGDGGTTTPRPCLIRPLFFVFCMLLLVGSASAIDFFENVTTDGDLPANETTMFTQWTAPFWSYLFDFIPDFIIRITQGAQGALLCIAFIAGIGLLGRIFR